MEGERSLDLESKGFYLSSSRFWYQDLGMKSRSLVFLCSELIQQPFSSFLAPE